VTYARDAGVKRETLVSPRRIIHQGALGFSFDGAENVERSGRLGRLLNLGSRSPRGTGGASNPPTPRVEYAPYSPPLRWQ